MRNFTRSMIYVNVFYYKRRKRISFRNNVNIYRIIEKEERITSSEMWNKRRETKYG